MSLPRQAFVRDYDNPLIVNVYGTETKKIAFTGITTNHCGMAYRNKSKVKKKWAVRLAPETKSK